MPVDEIGQEGLRESQGTDTQHLQAREERGSGAEGQQDTYRVVTRHGSHTDSRMRENCTYGSMRGIRRKTAKHVLRVAEGRADVPCGGVSPYSTPSKAP